jgi:integrase
LAGDTIREDRIRGPSLTHDTWIRYQRAYLRAIKSYYAPRTLETMNRGLRAVHAAFLELRRQGKVATTDPRRLKKGDIAAFMEWMKFRRTRNGVMLAHGTQSNYIDYLNGFLRFVDNGVIDHMRKLHYVRFPQKAPGEVRVLPESRVEEMRSKLRTLPGYEGAMARFMVAMYAYSGLRRSELRRARLEDLSVDTWTIFVAHPKGEGSWAAGAPARILHPARGTVSEFLAERARYLSDAGIGSCEALVPKVTDGTADYWSDAMWGKVKAKAERWCGIRFRIQTLRATFGQMCIDWGSRPDAVSRALRHKTTRTTELYYARIRADHAFRILDEAYDSAHRGKVSAHKVED